MMHRTLVYNRHDVRARLLEQNEILCFVIDPNPLFVVKLRSQLSANGIEFDEQTRQQLVSSSLTNYQKNDALLRWLLQDRHSITVKSFLKTLRESDQEHVANFLDGNEGALPVSDTDRRRLVQIAPTLVRRLQTIDNSLLIELRSRRVIGDSDYQRLNTETVSYRRNLLLIDVLLRGSQRALACFVDALEASNQADLKALCEDDAQRPLESPSTRHILEHSRSQLKFTGESLLRCVNPDALLVSELMSQLSSRGLELHELTRQQLVSATLTDYQRNSILLQWLQGSSVACFGAFVQSLLNTEQEHVADLLLPRSSGQCDSWRRPLSAVTRTRLTRIAPAVVDVLQLSDSLLDSFGDALSFSDRELLKAEPSEYDRTVRLIDVLERGSVRSLLRVAEALDTTLAPVGKHLLAGEMVVIHVNVNESSMMILEDKIIAELSSYLRSRVDVANAHRPKLDSLLVELEQHNLKIVKVRRGNSILVYVYCPTVSSMDALIQLLHSGRLNVIIDAIFNTLVLTSSGLTTSVRLNDQQQFDACYGNLKRGDIAHLAAEEPRGSGVIECVYNRQWTTYFYELAGRHETAAESKQVTAADADAERRGDPSIAEDLHRLPIELHEIILMRSSVLLTKSLLKTDIRPHAIAHVTLSSVCQHFHRVVTERKWFRKELKDRLTALCRPFRLQPLKLQRLVSARCIVVRGQSASTAFQKLIDEKRVLVSGLTRLSNRLYVTYKMSETITVFDVARLPYVQLPDIRVNGLKDPVDLTSSTAGRCLYVSDLARSTIWKIKADHRTDSWLTIANVFSVSVTTDDQLVTLIATDVTGADGGRKYNGRVEIYGPDKAKIATVDLPRDMVNPGRAVPAGSRSFFVVCGTPSTALNAIREVDYDGAVVASYGGPPGGGPGQLDTPFDLAVDEDRRSVFVADMRNQRVLLMNRKLGFERLLLTWSRADGVYSPMCLYYDKEARLLMIGLYTGHVDVYRL